ncbi:prepilin-type N-terminal cleavage/methylation domain-containing protein [uncultured Propionivibrio sp.]|uniref:pilin n=1 Tax=uncultured Propionivibrio sp. TaxID=426737 RepID=UPI0029BFBF1C|nr:prepilin-type N-terminal cleavage/methylation domain-containing protein [uncultured Propionivibrio sp.]
MKKIQQGFTLIELMIVVAIIGILAAIAIPQYQDYVIRARLAKVNTAVASIKQAVAEYAQFNGGVFTNLAANDWQNPQNSGGLGMSAAPTTTPEIATLALEAGTGMITATLQNIGTCANTKTVTWTPSAGAGATVVQWTIGGTAAAANNGVCTAEIAKWR